MEAVTSSEAFFNLASSVFDFSARNRSSTNSASLISLPGRRPASARPASIGRKAISTPIRFAGMPDFLMMSTARVMVSTEPMLLYWTSATQSGSTAR